MAVDRLFITRWTVEEIFSETLTNDARSVSVAQPAATQQILFFGHICIISLWFWWDDTYDEK